MQKLRFDTMNGLSMTIKIYAVSEVLSRNSLGYFLVLYLTVRSHSWDPLLGAGVSSLHRVDTGMSSHTHTIVFYVVALYLHVCCQLFWGPNILFFCFPNVWVYRSWLLNIRYYLIQIFAYYNQKALANEPAVVNLLWLHSHPSFKDIAYMTFLAVLN